MMLLEAKGISVAYDGVRALWDVSISVERGEIVALLGPNGSGKSTLMNGISRLVALESGTIVFDGQEIQKVPPYRTVGLGMAHVLERHRLFPQMTVLENLILGAGPGAARASVKEGLEQAFALFPRLAERQHQVAGSLSGGEQQMCAIARGLMSKPRLLLVDEPFIGLSPRLRSDVERALRTTNQSGVSILLIEQNVKEALRMSRRAYILRTGRVVISGPSDSLAEDDVLRRIFMGAELAPT
ncbi:MAG: ABC transporter ATP-binding protein [Hyphomicrobiales bacterium]|nr:ABC transporter ATP-binding protein [Hyphomicrobiales bacterium]